MAIYRNSGLAWIVTVRGDPREEYLLAMAQASTRSDDRHAFHRNLVRLEKGEVRLAEIATCFDKPRAIHELDQIPLRPEARMSRPWAAIAGLREGPTVLLVLPAFTGGAAERDAARMEAQARHELEFDR
jgi:hypothetical protein